MGVGEPGSKSLSIRASLNKFLGGRWGDPGGIAPGVPTTPGIRGRGLGPEDSLAFSINVWEKEGGSFSEG